MDNMIIQDNLVSNFIAKLEHGKDFCSKLHKYLYRRATKGKKYARA